MIPRRLHPMPVLVALLGILFAACGPSGPTVGPSASAPSTTAGPTGSPTTPPDPAVVYATIEEQVRAIRSLEAKTPVDPKVFDEAALGKYIQEQFRKDNPKDLIYANQRLLNALGLLSPDASLEDLYIELLSSQVAGLYNPDEKTLYVVSKSGSLGPTEKTTFAHEYTHALQDQNFGLAGMDLDAPGEGDRAIARLSLVEGDATLVMTLWQIDNLTQAEILQLFGEALDPKVTAALEKMPPVLRDGLLFPYTGGLNFVQGLHGGGGWEAVNKAFAEPPASTEQILHPEKYQSGEAPLKIDLPNDLAARMGPAWSVGLEDTLGEFQLKVWLAETAGKGAVSAETAAAGWGGDRVAVLDGPGDDWAIILRTQWDTAADGTEFDDVARRALPNAGGVTESFGSGTDYWLVIAPDREVLARAADATGASGG